MASIQEMLKRGVAAAQAGKKDQARQILRQVVKAAPKTEIAWLWLARVSEKKDAVFCLRRVLQINPDNQSAIKGLQAMGVQPPQPKPEPAPPSPEPEPSGEMSFEDVMGGDDDDVPSYEDIMGAPAQQESASEAPAYDDFAFEDDDEPDYMREPAAPAAQEPVSQPAAPDYEAYTDEDEPDYMQQEPPAAQQPTAPTPAMQAAQQIEIPTAVPGIPAALEREMTRAISYLDERMGLYLNVPNPDLGIEWAEKTRGRYGDRAFPKVQVAIISVIVLVVIGAGLFVALVLPMLNRQQERTAARATNTRVNTSTPTATATAGMTLTPSLTPRLSLTPSPTYPPDVPDGAEELRVSGQLEPTEIHYRTPRPSYPEVGEMLEAYAEGDCERVLELVEQVEALDTITTFAEVYYYQATCLAQEGRYGQAEIAALKGQDEDADAAIFPAALGYIYLQTGSSDALTQSQRAIQLDPYLKLPVITLARYYGERGEYNQGLREIARLEERRPYDAELILEKGKLYLLRGDPGDALYQANLARHIDPTSAESMKLQARAALALGNPGGAVLAMRDLLFYYPDSVEGYRILGDARAAEGNINLALEAYGRALNAPEVSAEVGRTYIARGQLYTALERHAEAYADFDKAANILTPPPTEALEGRITAAIATGRTRSALEDVETLLEREPERQEWRVLQARLLIEQEDYEEAGKILVELLGGELQDNLRDDVLDYAARVDYHMAMEEDTPDPQLLETALASNENALIVEETAGRRYYRALILDALDRDAQALRELEWLSFWDHLYDYAFADDVQERIAALTE